MRTKREGNAAFPRPLVRGSFRGARLVRGFAYLARRARSMSVKTDRTAEQTDTEHRVPPEFVPPALPRGLAELTDAQVAHQRT
jgi:hypothetical protein